MKSKIFAFILALVTTPAAAETYMPVKDEQAFRSLIADKQLRNYLYGVRLNVLADGEISGAAWGWDITGSWVWQDGYFCRELSWGGDPIPYNCQLVEAKGEDRLRFSVDQGAGDSASFSLQ